MGLKIGTYRAYTEMYRGYLETYRDYIGMYRRYRYSYKGIYGDAGVWKLSERFRRVLSQIVETNMENEV